MDLDSLLASLPEPALYPLPNLSPELSTVDLTAVPGRTTKLTKEVQERICTALRAGNTRLTAAQWGGISEATFYNWLDKGRNPETTTRGKIKAAFQPFLEFLEAVTRAETEAQVRNVAVLQKAASGHQHEKTTTKTVKKVVGTTDDGKPIMATETTTTSSRWTEYDWRAALEWLKRRDPKQWGDRLKIEEEVEFELTNILDALKHSLPPEQYEKALEAIARSEDR